METVVSVSAMRDADRAAIEGGIPEVELIHRAGRALFDSYPFRGPVAVVSGEGNNGADGLTLAVCLAEAAVPCHLFLLSEPPVTAWRHLLQDAIAHGVPVTFMTTDVSFDGYSEIVDCLYGTGFRGSLRGLAAIVTDRINEADAVVISADIPSGLNGDTGLSEHCVHADMTVAIQWLKTGLLLNRGQDVCGRLLTADIGIPRQGEELLLPSAGDFSAVLRPRLHAAHKGTYGYVSLLGGCARYSGAVKLANMSQAALRAGCGVSRLCVPACLTGAVSPYLLESTLCPLPDTDGFMRFDQAALEDALRGVVAVSVGMGWGMGPDNGRILTWLLETCALPVMIDADGLNTLAKLDMALLRRTRCRVILTPHPKEFERLSGVPVAEAVAYPALHAAKFAREYGCIVLLKGTATVITDGSVTYLVARGAPGMATAGSGDVLSGILTGLLGYNQPSALTVACGAYLAGVAGELAERDGNPISMTAGDTARHVTEAVSLLLCEQKQ